MVYIRSVMLNEQLPVRGIDHILPSFASISPGPVVIQIEKNGLRYKTRTDKPITTVIQLILYSASDPNGLAPLKC